MSDTDSDFSLSAIKNIDKLLCETVFFANTMRAPTRKLIMPKPFFNVG